MTSERITVFGAGYVGLVTAACLAHSGHRVRAVDVNREKLAELAAARAPFFEPGLDEILSETIAAGRLTFLHLDELAEVDQYCYVAVGTPSAAGGAANLRYVRDVVERIARTAAAGTIVVMKSTVPPGTGAELAAALEGGGIEYVSNPEFLREGTAVADWWNTDRIVLGGSASAVARVAALYADIDAPVCACDISSAELVKYASNAFLATKISFINEIAAICEAVDADVSVVAEAVGLDRRIGAAFLNAGIGYGGSCFPKDTRALDFLSTVNGYEFHLLKAVISVNSRQRLLPVMALRRRYGSLAGLRVAVLGLTFKPETDDTREAPALEIVEQLAMAGAEVTTYDPRGVLAVELPATRAATLLDAVRGVHAVVIATEWAEFVAADWSDLAAAMEPGAFVFDGRNCLDPERLTAAGLSHARVGRSASPASGAVIPLRPTTPARPTAEKPSATPASAVI